MKELLGNYMRIGNCTLSKSRCWLLKDGQTGELSIKLDNVPLPILSPGEHKVVIDNAYLLKIDENYKVIPMKIKGILEPVILYSFTSINVLNDETKNYKEKKLGEYSGHYVRAGKMLDDRITRAFFLEQPLEPIATTPYFVDYDD